METAGSDKFWVMCDSGGEGRPIPHPSKPQPAGFLACLCDTGNREEYLLILCCFPLHLKSVVKTGIASTHTVAYHGDGTSRQPLTKDDQVFFSLPNELIPCGQRHMENTFLRFLGHDSFQEGILVRVKKTGTHSIEFFKQKKGQKETLCTLEIIPTPSLQQVFPDRLEPSSSQEKYLNIAKNSKLWKKVATLEQLLPIMEYLKDYWWKLGIELKLSEAVVDNIDRDYRLTSEKTRTVLWRWMEHEGSDATIGRLAVAINKIGGKRTAQKLLEQLENNDELREKSFSAKNSKLWKKVPTVLQLLPIVGDLGDRWHELGIALNLENADVCNIGVDYRYCRDKALAVLCAWLEQKGRDATIGRLAVAMNQIGEKSKAQTLLGAVMTPEEILARGPLAVQSYNKALEEGKANVRRLPIMLIGQQRMGKTSLKKSLKGDLFDAEEESTIGIEVDPSYCKTTTEIWRPGKLDERTSSDTAISFEHQAARLIASDIKGMEETAQATTGEPTQATNDSQPHHGPSTNRRDTHVTTPKVTNTNEWDQEQEQSSIEPDMPDDLTNLITKSLFEDVKEDEEEQIYSLLWDFGGQSVYYVTHPLYLTTRAIYVLVYDLSRNPNDRAIPFLKQGMFRKLEDSFSVKTNLDYLDSWMSSVASLVSDGGDGDEVPASHETEKLPSKLPPVFFVCTHADQIYCGRDSATLAAEIFGSLQGKPYSSHLFNSVFVVDNSKSGSEHECPEVVRLRKEILAVAKELPQMKKEIPLKWLRFEKELLLKIKEGYKWIPLENAKHVAFEMCHISEEEEFTTLMKFLHDQRILIHFDETPSLNKMVVLDIQWLINVFKKVITVEPYGGIGKEYKELWLKLEKTGVLEEKLIEHVWGPLYENKETFESLIEIMERFSLLCIWPDESKQYLVPSMLMSHPSEDIIQLVASSEIPSLYLTFNSSQVPIGLFPRMVLQFYQWCSKEWPSPCKPQLYHNFVRFHVCPDEGCSVILLCHSSFIEIVVHRASEVRDLSVGLQEEMKLSPNLASDPTPDVTIARAVRRQVVLMLECMRKEFVWLKNMKCEMKVLCSVCCPGGSVHYCRDHATKGCKQEECLHFWSETVLQRDQQFVICDRSAVAGDPRLSIKQFAAWFAFLDEQQAIYECAARELPSIEEKETKTLILSTGVLESLQSACDASAVVARLQDNLQLNQAALADPEPETTRMVRCLAAIAKNENRRDVVQHLRQITPAGTTGPLLPERLDVRKIPSSLIRDLTITLCGGEEWQLVAEKLGLSPNEIRYLDKRTMNPCKEALVHSRNQRFINVDTLYNVLVECGLPMLADLL